MILGAPTRFLTATFNAGAPGTPAQHQRQLVRAISLMFRELRRLNPGVAYEYFSVLEETQLGQPHYHILIRGPRIPHAWISAFMAEHCDSPIVWIEAIDSAKKAAFYLAKYLMKDPVQFAGSRRWTRSRNYFNDEPAEDDVAADIDADWLIFRSNMSKTHLELLSWGAVQRGDGDEFRYYDTTNAYFPRGPDPALMLKRWLADVR